jgi:UDP:flavonoid glycosyltransferase YjiC (YdhE family)
MAGETELLGEPAATAAGRRRRVLFVAEAVTLAHIARPIALAQGLDPDAYDVVLASAPRYAALWRDLPIAHRPIHSITSEQFQDALAQGQPLYDVPTLRRYVEDDLEVIRQAAPDVVVGDFRLSLAVSARLAGVPYLAIANAYWSPYARRRFPMPELPLARRVGVPAARVLFGLVRPLAFALHTLPLNRVRRDHGLPGLGLDLCRVYTEADHTLYADIPGMVPTADLPANHHYLGPILWSPAVATPPWWHDLPPGRPAIYVTLGSSGPPGLLAAVLDALADLPVTVMAATVGARPERVPSNVLAADYLPGREAAARARLVICNGGSPTAHQALAAGVPVLGLASNLDQHLNMQEVRRLGAGEVLRSGTADARLIRAKVVQMLENDAYARAAAELAKAFALHDAPSRFRAILSRVLARQDARA